MDRLTAATNSSGSIHPAIDIESPQSKPGADIASQKAMHKLQRMLDKNQDISWPGRLDPCNRSQKLPVLLQELLKQLDSGQLNGEQRKLARHDLQMIAVRCFYEGRVGQDHELVVTFQGKTLKLDAIHLAQLLQNSPDDLPSANAFHEIVQASKNSPTSRQAIKLSNPEPSHDLQLSYENFSSTNDFKGPFYAEMKRENVKTPLSNFDEIQRNYAKQVIDCLPPANQGKLRGVPAQLIGVDAYTEVLRVAAYEKKLPSPLMEFRESCEHDNGLKRAIYSNPHIAARILGLSPKAIPNNQEAASLIAQPIVDTVIPKSRQTSSVTKFAHRIVNFGLTETMRLIDQAFKMLGEFSGFRNQEMADVPSCFPDIQCPESTAVELTGDNLPTSTIHANYVSMGHGRQAIAAMQPVHEPETKSSNLAGFYQLLVNSENINGTTVVDLRSGTDFGNGSHDYCPPLGEGRLVKIPNSRETIEISTVKEQDLPSKQCKEITLRIQLGDLQPKDIKVVQFREWPDHGVVTPDELRALREVVAESLEEGQCLITHCRAGVGRTGTLLAYENLYNDLIIHGNGKNMIDANGKVNRRDLLEAVTRVVAQGRMERGPYFVQKEDQFKLLYTTLKADLQANANKDTPKVTQSGPSGPSNISPIKTSLPGRTFAPEDSLVANLTAEPTKPESSWQHWDAILENGENVIEIISTTSRLVGSTMKAQSGLGVLINQLIQANKASDNSRHVQFGSNRLLAITPHEATKTFQDGELVHTQQFVIQYQTEGDTSIKSLTYTQFLTPFDGKKLTAKQLNETIEQLNQEKSPPKLICSANGVGRPSALLIAQAMQTKILDGSIKTEKELTAKIDEWTSIGRKEIGPLFINSREQRQQLIMLGKSWLTNKSAGEKITARVQGSDEDVRRSKKLSEMWAANQAALESSPIEHTDFSSSKNTEKLAVDRPMALTNWLNSMGKPVKKTA